VLYKDDMRLFEAKINLQLQYLDEYKIGGCNDSIRNERFPDIQQGLFFISSKHDKRQSKADGFNRLVLRGTDGAWVAFQRCHILRQRSSGASLYVALQIEIYDYKNFGVLVRFLNRN
jgi:hypothetical protein